MPDSLPTDNERLREAKWRRVDARARADVPASIAAALDCANAQFELGEEGFGLRYFQEALALVEKSGARRELLPELCGMTGRVLQRLKAWPEVRPWYERAANEARAQGLVGQELRWMGKQAMACFDMHEPELGRELLAKSVAFGRTLRERGHPVEEELARQIQRMASLPGSPVALWKEVARLFEGRSPSRLKFDATLNHAMHLLRSGKHRIAQTYIEEADEIGRAIGADEKERVALCLRHAAVLREKNEPEEAGDALRGAVVSFAGAHHRVELLHEATDCYAAARRWRKMRDTCQALRDAEPAASPLVRYDNEMRLSIACEGLGEVDASLAALDAALRAAREIGRASAITAARGRMVTLLVERGDHGEAVRLARELWDAGERTGIAARVFVKALLATGDVDGAQKLADEFGRSGGAALESARLAAQVADAGHGDARAAWYAVGAAAKRDPGVEAEALSHLLAFHPLGSEERCEIARHRLRLVDRARNAVSDVFSEASWSAAVEEAPQFPGYLDAFVEAATSCGKLEDAVYELERFRSQTLVNVLAERNALWASAEMHRGRLKSSMTADLQRARYRFAGLAARGAPWRERREAAEELDRLRTLELSAEGLLHVAPADQTLHFPRDLATLLGKTHLAAGEALVIAHPLPDRIAAWSIDREGGIETTSIESLDVARVERIGRTLRSIDTTEEDVDVAALIDEIDARFAAPLSEWLTKRCVKRAFLAAGTSMATLPLDACASASGIEICTLPTAAALGFVRAVRRPLPELHFIVTQEDRDRYAAQAMRASRGRVAVVLDPTRELEFAPLEAAMVAASNHRRCVEVLDRSPVAVSDVTQACAASEILHFVSHGTFDDASPYRSGMYVGPREEEASLWTNAAIFSDVKAPAARLAVLSGCRTGDTKPNLVSEEVSLPAALIAAGCACVVASRWPVDDLSTTLLMGDFYDRWNRGGVTVAAALAASKTWLASLDRAAVLALVAALPGRIAQVLPTRSEDCRRLCAAAAALLAEEAEGPFADPYSWASFYVAGDGAIASDGADRRAPKPGGVRLRKRKTP